MKTENVVRYGVLIVLLAWAVYAYPSYAPLPELTAKTVNLYLGVLGIGSVEHNNLLLVDFGGLYRIFDISPECSGLVLMSVFLFGIFITPQYKLSYRLGSLVFIPILFIGNSFRVLVSMILARTHSPELSIMFHNTIGQVYMFALAILCWVVLLKVTHNFMTERSVEVGG